MNFRVRSSLLMHAIGIACLTFLAGASRRPSEHSLNVIPRGPPRKPKQSGHALWVGNLPPGATVIDLKDHFSRDATRDIESLFLISKSNCAFVNYRSEAACAAAMQRFHDSRFQGVRLVCRLRRSSTAASGVPTAPASMSGRRMSTSSSKSPVFGAPDGITEDSELTTEDRTETDAASPGKAVEKFFIVKSLTLQDLEQSVVNGIWATQAHNEEALNKAYEVSYSPLCG
jgi:RNA recognition motif-containing protein